MEWFCLLNNCFLGCFTHLTLYLLIGWVAARGISWRLRVATCVSWQREGGFNLLRCFWGNFCQSVVIIIKVYYSQMFFLTFVGIGNAIFHSEMMKSIWKESVCEKCRRQAELRELRVADLESRLAEAGFELSHKLGVLLRFVLQSSIYLEPETSTLKWLFGVPGKTKIRKTTSPFWVKRIWCGNHRADGLEHSDVCCKFHCTGLALSLRAERPWGVPWVGERSFHDNAWSKYRNGNHAANHFHHPVTFW